MLDVLYETVRTTTELSPGYQQHAAYQSMDVYLDDWEKAAELLAVRIARLRALRDDRRANGFPPSV